MCCIEPRAYRSVGACLIRLTTHHGQPTHNSFGLTMAHYVHSAHGLSGAVLCTLRLCNWAKPMGLRPLGLVQLQRHQVLEQELELGMAMENLPVAVA